MKHDQAFELKLDEAFPHLAYAPIVEAVIHWAAKPAKQLDRNGVQRELAQRLPDYAKCQAAHELELELNAPHLAPDQPASTQSRRDSWLGFRLTSADGLQIVQFHRDGVVFSRLAPYDKWDTFVASASRVWDVYRELADPSEVQRLGVRFINRISQVRIGTVGQWLSRAPKGLDSTGLPLRNFLFQSVHDVPGFPYQVRVVETVQPPALSESADVGLLLDIDVYTTQPFAPQAEVLDAHLERLHWLKNKAFFSLLSKKALQRLEKGSP